MEAAGIVRERHLRAVQANGWMTDEGLRELGPAPELHTLDIGGYQGKVTDAGLQNLRRFPGLRNFQMPWQQGVTDAGVANLTACPELEIVNVMGTPTGDGLISGLRGKSALWQLSTGQFVTDAGLTGLSEFPVTRLLIDGPYTNSGLQRIAGMHALEDLDLFWHSTGITPDGFGVLAHMPRLTTLGCDGDLSNDAAMAHFAAIPGLRNLRAQSAVAGDEGFEALGRSRTLERFWGRECPNLTGQGFSALSGIATLQALGVGCRNLDDAALSRLPEFPALRELTSIGISDAGFRHVGACAGLERLLCMYCRDTTDLATGWIAGLRLKYYYAGMTGITDASLEILAGMDSLESVELYRIQGVTAGGVAKLAARPGLRVEMSG